MKKQELFDEQLEQATEIRTHIQDELRAKYNELKHMFEAFIGEPGKVLKHVTDMYHYRNGGYPNENSAPKHQELIERFAWMIRWFNLTGLSKQYKDELQKYGITITVDPEMEIFVASDPVIPTALEVIQETPELRKFSPKVGLINFKHAIRAFLFACDQLQGAICANSNTIKKEIAPLVEQNCEVRKGDFTTSVMVNYHKTTGKITKKKVQRLEKNLKSKVETGTYNINNVKDEIND